ncbi:MBL fold metallo-hydrolase [Pseudomonas sp. MH10]|uniref:MBL fold metallo-hydrolase n=1 Tax=Pseudomonas sp. MH10 TaxID=3048627 RepID=UPI002AC94904|nr:MBL fold metallo-hydrolase [Pseudomonas sp. MH10]MEB0043669.1 MBL fold metallo-hydrolase [Pseudomonas sp. MH10]WPX63897.1 MBL fold metallo-hydrolase [Pseudomonas sp. MH10]
MQYPEVIHHGAIEGVTGSCHQLQLNATISVLIDCGSFQGAEADSQGVDKSLGFPIDTIKALVVTHVHADHVGRIPSLLAAGFKGPILCSEPSAKLLPLVLEDAFKFEFGRDEQQLSQYLDLVNARIIALPFDHWFNLAQTPELYCRVRLQRAGHILGSAYVEFDVEYPIEQRAKRIVFSGDLGSSHMPFLPSPKSPERADLLVLESTYGDRLHEDRSTRISRLEAVIDKALADHGTVLIPAFSIGRTQELLYEIEDILHRKSLNTTIQTANDGDGSLPIHWPELPVILDSPLASRFTKVYLELDDFWEGEAKHRSENGRKPLQFNQMITIDSHAKHLQTVNYLASTGRPAIVIAGHGMCSGGRIVNYLKAMLGDVRHNVLFVGYQVKGTPGAAIQMYGDKGGYVELDRERYPIRAGVTTIGGYSAHADQQGLVEFVTGMDKSPSEIRLVHGEANAKKELSKVLLRKYELKRMALTIDTK